MFVSFPNDVEFLFCHAAKVRVATQKKTGWLVAIRSNWKFITVVYEVKKEPGRKIKPVLPGFGYDAF